MHFIDLFAGAGGLSEGFIKAGFKPVAHVEMDRDASRTLETRTAYHYLKEYDDLKPYTDYITGQISRDEMLSFIPKGELESVINQEISEVTIDGIYERIDKRVAELGLDRVPLIVGGPPCQAYSLIGRARNKDMENDPRNFLYLMYLRFLKRYKPDMFVFENVPGILTARGGTVIEDIKAGMRNEGYTVEARLLNAADYGVLQTRKRLIFVGWKQELDMAYPELEPVVHGYFVKDLLEDLPPLKAGEKMLSGQYRKAPAEFLKSSGIRCEDDVLTQHECRAHNERDLAIYRCCVEQWNQNHSRLNYFDLPEELITHKNRAVFRDKFKVVAGDLPASQTVVAHISKDGHYFIHPDIEQNRSISVREAARLQTFPDSYFFEGARGAKFRQIGNAVPPILGELIANKIKNQP